MISNSVTVPASGLIKLIDYRFYVINERSPFLIKIGVPLTLIRSLNVIM